jgi:protein-L-isoaspartate(D-aspartate) O-methyltransferase
MYPIMNIKLARQNMLKCQLRDSYVIDSHIRESIDKIPREFFVPEMYISLAYSDTRLPLGHGQVMMTPTEEARILHALLIKPNDRILEVGTGTGYFTALLANAGAHVFSIDIFSDFIISAEKKLKHVGIKNVSLLTADAVQGLEEKAPYDVIVITASMPLLPTYLIQQLVAGGNLFVVLGNEPVMTATIISRQNSHAWSQKNLFETELPVLLNAPKPELFVF